MIAVGFFFSDVAILTSSWGDVSMSMTPDAPNTTVRPNHSSLITQPVLAVVVMLLVAVACSSKIHTSLARAQGARSELGHACKAAV